MSIVTKTVRKFLIQLLRYLGACFLFLLSLGLLYAVLRYHVHDPSLFYRDSAITVSWSQWLFSSCAALLFYFLGIGAFLAPVFFAHGAWISGGWRELRAERVRLIAMLLFVAALCLWSSLGSGIFLHNEKVYGGLLGAGLRVFVQTIDPLAVRLCLLLIMGICLTLITRLVFVGLSVRAVRKIITLVSTYHVVQRVGIFILVVSRKLWASVCWLMRKLVYQRTLSNVPTESQDITIDAIIQDVFWQQCKRTSGVKTTAQESVPTGAEQATGYQLPPRDLLVDHQAATKSVPDQQRAAQILEEKLAHFDIQGHVTSIKSGPVVTCFSYEPAIDTKISKIVALEHDLALALQALSLRIIAPIPGTNVVGFEVARADRQVVSFAQVVHAHEQGPSVTLPLILGCDVIGQPVLIDLATCPHLLMAGATGSGKSVALHTMILSLLLYKKPEELQLVLIDPKRLELCNYEGIAHLAAPVIHEAAQAVGALEWVLAIMQARYERMAVVGARTLAQYQVLAASSETLPHIVVIIDELADLMMVAGSRLELLIARIAQMARAAGIHLIVATQRPSVDVVTGLIKVNFVSRIALRVTSAIDSRVILDEEGAQRLLGAGDMLMRDAHGHLKRVHGAYCTSDNITRVVDYIREQSKKVHDRLPTATVPFFSPAPNDVTLSIGNEPLYQEVLKFLNEIDEVSISLLQRRFKIGFNRSARIIDTLEAEGRLVRIDGGKTRKVVRSQ